MAGSEPSLDERFSVFHVQNGRVTLRSGRDRTDRDSAQLLEAVEVPTGVGWKVSEPRNTRGGFRPSRHGPVFGLTLLEHRKLARELLDRLTAVAISGTDLYLLESVQNIELRDRQSIEAVHAVRISHHHAVEPTAAARPSGRGTKLFALPP